MKKSELINNYNTSQKFAKNSPLSLAAFRMLTNNYFDSMGFKIIISYLPSTGTIEGFMNTIDVLIKMKKEANNYNDLLGEKEDYNEIYKKFNQ